MLLKLLSKAIRLRQIVYSIIALFVISSVGPTNWVNPQQVSKRLAVIMYGILDHDSGLHGAVPANISLYRSISSLNRHVIEPARSQGYAVDVFVHSWSVMDEGTILKLYNPVAHLIENGSGAFQSIEAGLLMRRFYEAEYFTTYDWAFVVRHDMHFRTDFDFDGLNRSLFYISNWCIGTISSTQLTSAGLLSCTRLERFKHDYLGGVPDFWYLSNPESMDAVFLNLTRDLASGVFVPTQSCCNHAIAGGRIFSLHDQGIINIGRYQVHSFDYDLYRMLDPKKEWINELGLSWNKTNDYDLMTSNPSSVCVGTFCNLM